MKKLFYTLIFSIITLCSIAQNEINNSFNVKEHKGCEKLILVTGKTKAENYKFCNEILSGIDVATQSDESTLVIKTDMLNTKKKGYSYYLTFFCKDSTINVTGKFNASISVEMYGVRSESNFESILNKGMKGSPYEIAFSEMLSIAQKFNCKINAQ